MKLPKKYRSAGAYYLTPKAMQVTLGVPLPNGHRAEDCQWCRAYAQGREKQPCPDRQQLELFQ